jgi:hypothetical protein
MSEEPSAPADDHRPHWEVRKLRAEVAQIQWEAKKLRAEVHDLGRHSFLKPGFWVSAATAVAALVGIGLQYLASEQKRNEAHLDLERATILRERAQFDADRAVEIKTQAERETEAAQERLAAIRAEIGRLTANNEDLNRLREDRTQELAQLNGLIAKLKDKAAVEPELNRLLSVAETFQQKQTQVLNKVASQNQLIEKLGRKD